MPAKLRAGGVFPYILEEDREDVTEPQFDIRIISVGDNEELAGIRLQFVSEKSVNQRRKLLDQAMSLTVAGCRITDWSNKPLRQLLTERECWELINAATVGASLTADERKKFVLPPRSETDLSADVAERPAETE